MKIGVTAPEINIGLCERARAMARDKLIIHSVSLAMKLFRRRRKPPKQADETPVPAAPAEISLSAEQKSLLEKPIDPKANKMLQKGVQRIVPAPPPEAGARILDCL
jgi:hypothetical protein